MSPSLNQSNFKRPPGIDEGFLINSDSESLIAYKKAKKRLSSIPHMENQINILNEKYDSLNGKMDLILSLLESKK